MPTPRDYDTDPARYRLGMRLTAAHGTPGADLYRRIVGILQAAGAERVLDLGCGDGALAEAAAGTELRVTGLDAAAPMVRAAGRYGPVVRGELAAVPVADDAVDAVVAVNVLDHLEDPRAGLREARRVLRPGGLFVAGVISRFDSPELAPFWRPSRTPFDAEEAPGLVAAVFGGADAEVWDAPLLTLPDRGAVRDFLMARFVAPTGAESAADRVAAGGLLPLTLTKRGALVLARR